METPLVAPVPQRNHFFDLRPMSIGDFLDRVVYFYRSHFVSIVLYSLFLAVPNTILIFFYTWFSRGMEVMATPSDFSGDPTAVFGQLGQIYGVAILINLITGFLVAFQTAGIAAAVRSSFLEGRSLSTMEMVTAVRQKAGELLAIAFVSLLIWIPITCSILIPPIYMAIGTLYAFGVMLAYSILMHENRGVQESLRRGWLLITGGGKRALALLCVYILFIILFNVIILGVIAIPTNLSSAVAGSPLLTATVQAIVSFIPYILVTPLTFSAIGFLYFDLRIRSEGLDVALMSGAASQEGVDLAAAPVMSETVMGTTPRRSVLTLAGIYTILLVVLCGGIFAFTFLVGPWWALGNF